MDLENDLSAKTSAPLLLVVEPDANDAETLSRSLRTLGYRTKWSADGFDAMRQFRVSKPDMVLVNALLPDMYGSQMLEQVYRERSTPALMVINPTEHNDPQFGGGYTANDVVFKPVDFNEIAYRVSRIFRHVQTFAETEAATQEQNNIVCRLGPLRIDSVRQLVHFEQQRIDLTKTQFRFLEHLARHPGEIFDRDQLHRAARITSGNMNVIDVHIYNLRMQLQTYGLGYLIETVRGQGYRAWHDPKFLEHQLRATIDLHPQHSEARA